MSEYLCSNHLERGSVCRICLQTGGTLRNLPMELIAVLQILVPEMPSIMHTCEYCGYLAAKFVRFARQCRQANRMLTNSSLSPRTQLRPCHNLVTTMPVIESFGGVDVDILKTEEMSVCGDEPGSVDENDEGLDNDDDEIPLAMINKGVDVEYELAQDPISFDAPDTKVELEPIKRELSAEQDREESPPKGKEKSKKKGTKRQKSSKKEQDGYTANDRFTSRMVRETDRYLVVKLTKDEVRQQMADRSTSEAYLAAPFKCVQCVKGFNFEDVLRNHMERHSKEHGSLECDICFQHCPSAVSLRGHYKSHTTRYKCKVCGETRGSRQHLLEHYARTHAGDAPRLACPHCEFVTDKRTVLQRHARTHVAPALPCERCGRMFKTVEALRVHTSRHSRANLPRCGQCGARFVQPSALRRHVQAVHVNGDYYCVECDVRFKSPENMKNHFEKAKVHRKPSSFKHPCPECDAVLLTRATLSVHMCAAHGHARAHACRLCARAYGSRDALRGHERRAHRADVPARRHKCSVCDKAFEQKCSLTRHWRVHTGERAHACPRCPLRFAQASTRDTHRVLVHDRLPARNGKRKADSETDYNKTPD